MQGASLMICRKFIENDWLFIVIGIVITIIMAKYLNKVNIIIIKLNNFRTHEKFNAKKNLMG